MCPSRNAFQNWYFEYTEAKRAAEDAKRNLKLKSEDVKLFVFREYEMWCAKKFDAVIRPWFWVRGTAQEPVKKFYEEFQIYDIRWRSVLTRLLNQAFDKKYPNWRKDGV